MATLALYVLQGIPTVLLLLWSSGGVTNHDGEHVLTMIPYWTGSQFLVGVGLFGVALLLPAFVARNWSRKVLVTTGALATGVYVLSSVLGTLSVYGVQDPLNGIAYLQFFYYLSSSVAVACAVFWGWRTHHAIA